ncbi:MAG: hypothetical protein ABFD54_10875 [Armatimonadota bacterium]|nr:hypothetical protein [bacterium]
MDEREREKEVGYKGGASEAYAGPHPYYYEPTVTAVTDMVVPATRIQWGPVFAGLLIALSTTFLMTALGVGIGLSATGLGYWVVGFAALGLFLGSMFAARTSKSDIVPAIMHGVIIWALLMLMVLFVSGNIGGSILGSLLGSQNVAPGAAGANVTRIASNFGWWFFGGFLILLAASVLGGIVGMNPVRHEEVAPGQPPSTTRP